MSLALQASSTGARWRWRYLPGVERHSPPDRRRTETLLGDLLRWGAAASLAGLISFALLGGMARMVDGRWILDALVRVFPLSLQAVGEQDLAALPPEPSTIALSFEGTVGYLAGDRFIALGDAQIEGVGTLPGAGPAPIAVALDGRFRFDAALPKERSAESPGPQLVIRRPGCSERRLPVTPAWRAPRRITMDCG